MKAFIHKLKTAFEKAGRNAGFTLVEMIVVLAIISVVMGATAWGVTGWISHFEYISSEEKARTIYLAAQSALSGEEGRGTLDEYVKELRKNMGGDGDETDSTIFKQVDTTPAIPGENPSLKKADFGLPASRNKSDVLYYKDNEGNEHEYGYLSVEAGDYAHGKASPLFEMLVNYVSDKEVLNGSIVVEFDLTAGKVYSVFYSAWATSIRYKTSVGQKSGVRGTYYIYHTSDNDNARLETAREGYTVGYYASNQVNVITLDMSESLVMNTPMLFNRENLYLSMSSSTISGQTGNNIGLSDTDTEFEVTLFKKNKGSENGQNINSAKSLLMPDVKAAENATKICSFKVKRSNESGALALNASRLDEIEVTFANGDKVTMPFIVMCLPSEAEDELLKPEADRRDELCVILDSMMPSKAYALLDGFDKDTERTDSRGYSITRLLGLSPEDIYAEVSVSSSEDAPVQYLPSASEESNTENSLFALKDENSTSPEDTFEMYNFRHLSNIRYVEASLDDSDSFTYTFRDKDQDGNTVDDIDWKNACIYMPKLLGGDGNDGSEKLDPQKTGFPAIDILGEKSTLDGNGMQITGILIGNDSAVCYDRKADGTADIDASHPAVNKARAVGMFGVSKGAIQRLVFSGAKIELYSAKNATANNITVNGKEVFADSVEACGILCGRSEGMFKELYFDKDCSVYADLFADFDSDMTEAEADGRDKNRADINQLYATGVGMVAGTVVLNETGMFDRIQTAGSVEGTVNGSNSVVFDVASVDDAVNRALIFDDVTEVLNGHTNADGHAYGVGGVFGYVYGDYDEYAGKPKNLGIGIFADKADVIGNGASVEKTIEEDGYLTMYRRSPVPVLDSEGNDTGETKLVKDTTDDLFADWNRESIINKASVKGASFTGGIAGNVYISGLGAGQEKIVDGDYDIPDNAVPQLVNCVNYGDTDGEDFVGGIVGVNGIGSFIRNCTSYGKPSAKEDDGTGVGGGVSSGITAENFGYIYKCSLDRAEGDADSNNKAYIPMIKGNMLVAGAITSVNHEKCVIKDCSSALNTITDTDKIVISGNNMDTFGYLVGDNYGVINGGRAGNFLGYDSLRTKMIIGGACGVNYSVVKGVDVTFDFVDTGDAEIIGGVVGENFGIVKKCNFGGKITKNKTASSKNKDMSVGGIVGTNSYDGDNTFIDAVRRGHVEECYLIGADINVAGFCSYNETSSEDKRISESSAVGGICGTNEKNATVESCHVTGCCTVDANNKAIRDSEGVLNQKQTRIEVTYGIAGGIVAVNKGMVENSGYTDKLFYMTDERSFMVCEDTKDVTVDMGLLSNAISNLDSASSDDKAVARDGVKKLYAQFIDPSTGRIKESVAKQCGYLTNEEEHYQYALPKEAVTDPDNPDLSWNAYDDSANNFVISMSEGKGCVGGVVGYNASEGSVLACASGKWLVENYLPEVKYNATGGVIGFNSATGAKVSDLVNLAYVRNELSYIADKHIENTGRVLDADTKNDPSLNHRFYYLGGVIGTQDTEKSSNWTLDKCINVGTVLNYYGNNAGGVVGKACGSGGIIEYCYNYGTLLTGFTTAYKNGYSGTAGGIVGQYTDLKEGDYNNIKHCQNHGIVGFAAQGVNLETNHKLNKRGGMMANDVGGIVGEISAPLSKYLYTVNIVDCVNGKDARVYSYSTDSGIVGKVGCLVSEQVDGGTNYSVNNIFVNIDTCRNYSSNIWNCQQLTAASGDLKKNVAGIYSGRDEYDPSLSVPRLGYTTIQYCFSVSGEQGFNGNGSGELNRLTNHGSDTGHILGYSNNVNDATARSTGIYDNTAGRIASEKLRTPERNIIAYKYCGYNFFVDEVSFQYNNTQGLLEKTGYRTDKFNYERRKYATRVCAFVSDSAITDRSEALSPVAYAATENRNVDKVTADENRVDELSFLVGSLRMTAVAYGSAKNKYALVYVPYTYDIYKISDKNSWVDETNKKFHIITTDGDYETNILYTFTEKGSAPEYINGSSGNMDQLTFDRLLKSNSLPSGKKSRLPYADEYDMDYAVLDDCYVDYINDLKKDRAIETIKNVSVEESKLTGSYNVTWEVEASNGKKPMANAFKVWLRYYELPRDLFPDDASIDHTKFRDDVDDNYSVYELKDFEEKKDAYGTTAVFDPPENLERKADCRYFVVARVCDLKAEEIGSTTYYSEIIGDTVVPDPTTTNGTKTIRSYAELKKKLPTPEFEIVSYKNKWVLHLKNAEDYEGFVGLTNFRAGAYAVKGVKKDTSRDVYLTSANIVNTITGGTAAPELLNNKVDASKFATADPTLKLYGYVTCDGCLDSDISEFTAYVPKSADAQISYEFSPADESKLQKGTKPSYEGTLTYTGYADRIYNSTTKEYEYVSVIPPVAQQFKLELYGIRTDENGNEIHETLAVKNYGLSLPPEGETPEPVNINIGYYDVRRTKDLSVYDRFAVDCWCSSTSVEESVNYYFETDEENAIGKLRPTGFITDVSNVKTAYYYRMINLQEPQIDIVRKDRTSGWYVKLKNPEGFKEIGALVKVRFGADTRIATIDTSNPLDDPVLPYAAPVPSGGTGWQSVTYWSELGGSSSFVKNYSPHNETCCVQGNLQGNLNVNLKAIDFTAYTGGVGGFIIGTDGNLNFKAALKYNTHSTINQYIRCELYATNEKGEEKTLFLSDDILLDVTGGNTDQWMDLPEISLEADKIEGYHDFRVSCYLSKSGINNKDVDKTDEVTNFFSQMFEISEDAAKSLCYDETEKTFVDARANGLIIDVSGDEEKYYFAAPVKDPLYADTKNNTYKNYVLLRECDETIASVAKDANGDPDITVSGANISWTMPENLYGETPLCNLKVQVYKIAKADDEENLTVATLKEKGSPAFAAYTDEATDSYVVTQLPTETYDWTSYNYYAVVGIKDANDLRDDAYVDSKLAVGVIPPLPDPVVDIYTFGWGRDFAVLTNHQEFEDYFLLYPEYKDKTTITVEIEDRQNSPFTICFDKSKWHKTHKNETGTLIPYSVSLKKDDSGANNGYGNHRKDGTKVAMTAIAEAKDGDVIINQSANAYTASFYTPEKAEPAPPSFNYVFGDDTVRPTITKDASGKYQVNYSNTIGFTCGTPVPDVSSFGFSFVLTGEPKAAYDNTIKTVVLARKNDFIRLAPNGALASVDLTMDIDPSVDLTAYKNINLCIWLTDNGDDPNPVRHEIEIDKNTYDTYRKNNMGGVVRDVSSGEDKYYFIRYYTNAQEYTPIDNSANNSGNSRGYYRFKIDTNMIPE